MKDFAEATKYLLLILVLIVLVGCISAPTSQFIYIDF